jgi:DNA mismatch endonuclease, patch repair protein
LAAWRGAGSAERKARISDNLRRQWANPRIRPKRLAALKRVHRDPEVNRRRNREMRKAHRTPEYLAKWTASMQPVRRFRRTAPEREIASVLRAGGISFRPDLYLKDLRVRCDLFVRPNIAIFVDGCYYHGCPTHGFKRTPSPMQQRNARRDAVVRARFDAHPELRLVRVWEHDVKNPPQQFFRAIGLTRS